MLLFLHLFFFFTRDTFIHSSFIPSQIFADAHLHFFTAVGSVGDGDGVPPGRDSNSSLPFSKPAHYRY
jgi:hypothetical protein